MGSAAAPKRNQSGTDYARCASTVTATAERPSQSVISQNTDYVVEQGSKCLVLSVKNASRSSAARLVSIPVIAWRPAGCTWLEQLLPSISTRVLRLISRHPARWLDVLSGSVSLGFTNKPASISIPWSGHRLNQRHTNAQVSDRYPILVCQTCAMRRVLRSICHVWAGCRKTRPKT